MALQVTVFWVVTSNLRHDLAEKPLWGAFPRQSKDKFSKR